MGILCASLFEGLQVVAGSDCYNVDFSAFAHANYCIYVG